MEQRKLVLVTPTPGDYPLPLTNDMKLSYMLFLGRYVGHPHGSLVGNCCWLTLKLIWVHDGYEDYTRGNVLTLSATRGIWAYVNVNILLYVGLILNFIMYCFDIPLD